MIHFLFTVEVPNLEGGYVTHQVKWDDAASAFRVYATDEVGQENEVLTGNQLNTAPDGTVLYMVQESDGDTVNYRKIQSFPYAEVDSITSAPAEDDLTLTLSKADATVNGGNGSVSAAITGTNTPFSSTINGGSVQAGSNVSWIVPAGSYTVVTTDNLGYTRTQSITVLQPAAPEPDPVYGCTDPQADNYDPAATHDNGTCTYAPKTFSEVKVVEVLECADGVCLRWFNNLGGVDSWVFQGKVDKPFSSEAAGEFSYPNGLLAAASKSGQPAMVLRTANLNYNRYQAIWQLYTSPKVWIHHPDHTTEEVYVQPASIAPMPLGRKSYDITVELVKAPFNSLRK